LKEKRYVYEWINQIPLNGSEKSTTPEHQKRQELSGDTKENFLLSSNRELVIK